MKTIMTEVCNEIIINKSRFITIITPLNDVSLVSDKMSIIKDKYKGATHYCYGYIINYKEKCSDDGEPGGTAGMPILNVLKNNNLTNVLCVVARYFGGIKLGAGGLTRAYSNSVTTILSKCKFGVIEDGFNITITFNYDDVKSVDYILKDYDISKSFDEKITYSFAISKDEFRKLEENILKYCEIINKEDTIITKDDV